jgi:hypothetical protein
VLPGSSASWVRDGFAQRLEDWASYKIVDLDKAFGVKRDHRNIDAIRKRKQLTWRIISEVVEERRLGASREEALETAQRHELGRTTVQEIFDENPRVRFAVLHLPALQFKHSDH